MRLFFILYILLSTSLFAQENGQRNEQIDSLRRLIQTAKHDTIKIDAYKKWDHLIDAFDPDLDEILINKIDSICQINLGKRLKEDENRFYLNYDAWVSWSRAQLERDKRNFSKADKLYRKAISIHKKLGNEIKYCRAMHQLGINFYRTGEYDSAMFYYSQSVKIKNQIGYGKGLIDSYNDIGMVYFSQKNYLTARSFFEKSMAVADSLQLPDSKRDSYLHMGQYHLEQHDYKKAISFIEKSLDISVRKKQIRKSLGAYNSLSDLYYRLGDDKNSRIYREKAVDIQITLKDSIGLLNTLYSYSRSLSNQSNYTGSIEYALNAVEIANKLGNKRIESKSYWRLGWSNFRLADYEEALSYYQKAYEVAMEAGRKTDAASAMNKVAQAYKFLGKEELALEHSKKALNILGEGSQKFDAAVIIAEQGLILQYFGHDELVDEKLVQAINILENKGHGNHTSCHNLRNNRAPYLKAKGDYDLAIKNAQGLFRRSVEKNSSRYRKIAARTLFQIYMDLNILDSSQKYLDIYNDLTIKKLELNFPQMTEQEKEQYFEDFSTEFEQTYRFSKKFATNYPETVGSSYDMAIKTKGLLLKSSVSIRNSILESGDSLLLDKYHHWIGLQKGINELESAGREPSHLRVQAEEIEKELLKSSSAFLHLQELNNLNWMQVRDELPEDEAAIEFIEYQDDPDKSSEKKYAALILHPDHQNPIFVELCERKEIEKILGAYPGTNQIYINGIYGVRNNYRSDLYNHIWKPIAPHLEKSRKIHISPIGLLHKISFAALADENNKLLCEKHEIELVSSTSILAFKDRTLNNLGEGSITLFGGIDYSTDTTTAEIWNYLEGTLNETEEIKKIMDNNERLVQHFSHANATEEKFKEETPNSSIVHVATHGFFFSDQADLLEELVDAEESEKELIFRGSVSSHGIKYFIKTKNPLMRSGLIFAGANDYWIKESSKGTSPEEDGILTAQEVSTLDLRNTNLVVLSACETGLGDIRGSEGVYGLQRSFKMAGVKYLVMSLWQVPDKETAEFMEAFYKYITITGEVKKAFDLSQKQMREKYDPYYWAAFVLIE